MALPTRRADPKKYFYSANSNCVLSWPNAAEGGGLGFLYFGHLQNLEFYGQLMASWQGQNHVGRDFQNHTF